jgi:hypothetical protein
MNDIASVATIHRQYPPMQSTAAIHLCNPPPLSASATHRCYPPLQPTAAIHRCNTPPLSAYAIHSHYGQQSNNEKDNVIPLLLLRKKKN